MKACGRNESPPVALWTGSALVGWLSASAASDDSYGHAEPGQMGFQQPVTDLARYLQWFHNSILLP